MKPTTRKPATSQHLQTEIARLEQRLHDSEAEVRALLAAQQAHGAALPAEAGHVEIEKLALIGRWAAGISHDLRTHLATVTNLSFLLQSKIGPQNHNPEVREYLVLLGREVKRMHGLVEDVLGFSRPRVPTLELVYVNDLLTEALLLVQPMVETYGIEVRTNFNHQLPQIRGENERLVRVFTNLLANAVQAMPEGGILEIWTNSSKGNVEVGVCDSGHGMDEATRQKIFTPFFTTKKKGSGLGLVVAKQIVEAHRGTIEVESQPGQGATFRVLLPLGESRGGGVVTQTDAGAT